MFSGNSLSAKKLYLLYDRNNDHYNVITKFEGCNGEEIYMQRL